MNEITSLVSNVTSSNDRHFFTEIKVLVTTGQSRFFCGRDHEEIGHSAVACGLARDAPGGWGTGQGGPHRPAAPGRRDHRRRPLRERARPPGGAPRPDHRHERSECTSRADRGRAARSGGARDRGHRHAGAAGAGGGRHGARHPDGAGRAPDHGSRGHPPPGRRDARPADQPLPLLRLAGRTAGGRRRRHRLSVHRQAGHEQLRQGPEPDRWSGRRGQGLGDDAAASVTAASSSKASSTSTTRSRC
jgi:hypothetical protein